MPNLITVYGKDITQKQPNGRDAQGKVCGKGFGASTPSLGALPCQHLDVNPIVQGFNEGSIT